MIDCREEFQWLLIGLFAEYLLVGSVRFLGERYGWWKDHAVDVIVATLVLCGAGVIYASRSEGVDVSGGVILLCLMMFLMGTLPIASSLWSEHQARRAQAAVLVTGTVPKLGRYRIVRKPVTGQFRRNVVALLLIIEPDEKLTLTVLGLKYRIFLIMQYSERVSSPVDGPIMETFDRERTFDLTFTLDGSPWSNMEGALSFSLNSEDHTTTWFPLPMPPKRKV